MQLPYLDNLSDRSLAIPSALVLQLLAFSFLCIDVNFSFADLFKRTNTDRAADPTSDVCTSLVFAADHAADQS